MELGATTCTSFSVSVGSWVGGMVSSGRAVSIRAVKRTFIILFFVKCSQKYKLNARNKG